MPYAPDYTAYPTGTDLTAWLAGAGITLSAAISVFADGAAASAVEAFEQTVGRKMLADSEDAEWPFNPPQNPESILFLPQIDLSAAPTSVVYQPYNASPETLTVGLDYWAEPVGALLRGKPYTQIRFRRRWAQPLLMGERQSLLITGKFGYAASIPELAWNGMLARGAWELHALTQAAALGALVSWSDEDVTQRYSEDPMAYLRKAFAGEDGCGGMFGMAVAKYRKVEI